jgi:choline dehydrogenase-like flavoprotein
MASENEAMGWNFWVRHYSNTTQQIFDPKYAPTHDGVLYPRGGVLGGCSAINAMMMVYPHYPDWDHIAEVTGDASWGGDNMRRYFERMEDCRHRPFYRWLQRVFGWNPTRHGFGGWLAIEKPAPMAGMRDKHLINLLTKAVEKELKFRQDPNEWRLVEENAEGIRHIPLSTLHRARNGTREFLLNTAGKYPDRLTLELDALATRVLFDETNRAIGVAYLKGAKLYRASSSPNTSAGESRTVHVSREVILAGGAFNTPQLLMLSGIGRRDDLARHGIPVRVDLPGVGTNLQDRYEISVVYRLKSGWESLEGAEFIRHDPHGRMWKNSRTGAYASNGVALAIIKRSAPKRPLPDLLILAMRNRFTGYFPGYSNWIKRYGDDYLTWYILKAHTKNRGGSVTLRSADPRDPPNINFHYFDEGTDQSQDDLEAVVDGIEYVRRLTAAAGEMISEEEVPGGSLRREELRRFVKYNAWGRHACGSCAIGARTDPMAVLDTDFRVYGTTRLRVVDASVFPVIPGMCVVTPVYMVGEKASDAILHSSAGDIPGGTAVQEAESIGDELVPEARSTETPGPKIIRRTPHMDIRPQTPLEPDTAFEARVFVDRQAPRSGEKSVDVEVPAGTRVQLYLVVSGHFLLDGPAVHELIISAAPRVDAPPFRMRVKPAAQLPTEGSPQLSALFMHAGHPCGIVRRAVDIVGVAAEPLPPSPARFVLAPTRDADLHITVVAAEEKDGRKFICLVQTPHLARFHEPVAESWTLPDVTEKLVRGYMNEFTAKNATAEARIASLKGAGLQLFDASPKIFREVFWDLIDTGAPLQNIAVVSEEPFIPWELMIPNRRKPEGGRERRKPLGVEFRIGRWTTVDMVKPMQKLKLADSYIIAPNYVDTRMKLAHAQDEAAFVAAAFAGERIMPARFADIERKLTAGDRTLVHFVCHGLDSEAGPQSIELENNERLTSISVEGMNGLEEAFQKIKPIVFLNACEVGRPTPALVGLGGFAASFIRLGASAVVAPLWSVKDSIAHQIAMEFYHRVKEEPEIPFAEIFRKIREQAYDAGNGEDTYAAYCFYGDPMAARE